MFLPRRDHVFIEIARSLQFMNNTLLGYGTFALFYTIKLTGYTTWKTVQKLAGQPCSGFGQCVDHAECSAGANSTCKCKAGFYDAWGKCYTQVGAEKPCTGIYIG